MRRRRPPLRQHWHAACYELAGLDAGERLDGTQHGGICMHVAGGIRMHVMALSCHHLLPQPDRQAGRQAWWGWGRWGKLR